MTDPSTVRAKQAEVDGLTRRRFLGGAAGLVGAATGPFVRIRKAGAAGKVIVRTVGGAYEEALVKATFDPFTKATGVEVVRVPASAGKLLAMVESGNIELDVLDTGELILLILRQKEALDRIDYKGFKLTNPEDIDAAMRREDMVAGFYFANVLGYNSQVFPTGKHPRSWAEFWDIRRFPGPRMLQDISAGFCDLEFALLADGVPKEKLYPIDVDRAFKSLSRVRPAITKFWEVAGVSAQLMADKEVVLGSISNGRIQALIDKGAPLAIEWNQALLQVQHWAVLKKAPNREHAHRLIDFALQPQIQAAFGQYIAFGPTNRQAFKYIPREAAQKLASNPTYLEKAILQNVQWWAENRDRVSTRWSQWLLEKG
jgi:putative spermidine/putrescine transport system substrate-binding protein